MYFKNTKRLGFRHENERGEGGERVLSSSSQITFFLLFVVCFFFLILFFCLFRISLVFGYLHEYKFFE